MKKEELKAIVKKATESVWYNRRSMNPVEEQTELITDVLFEALKQANGAEKSESTCNLQNVSHCACSVDETTGWTQVKCCNICGKPLKDQNWHCG